MGFNNPSWSWSELEATLSDRASLTGDKHTQRDGRVGIAVC